MAELFMVLIVGVVANPCLEFACEDASVKLSVDAEKWEGTWEGGGIEWIEWPRRRDTPKFQVRMETNSIVLRDDKIATGMQYRWIDEGKSRCRIVFVFIGRQIVCLGVYKREAGCLVVCLADVNKGRPTVFRAEQEQALIIIRRVKPER